MQKIVVQFATGKKTEMKQEIEKRLENGERPSVTTDEWTGLRARRYAGIKIHFVDKIYCAGLVRIIGSLDAHGTQVLLEKKLLKFGLPMSKVTRHITDKSGSTHWIH